MIHDVEKRRYLSGGGWGLQGVSKGIRLLSESFLSDVIVKFTTWQDWGANGGSVRFWIGA